MSAMIRSCPLRLTPPFPQRAMRVLSRPSSDWDSPVLGRFSACDRSERDRRVGLALRSASCVPHSGRPRGRSPSLRRACPSALEAGLNGRRREMHDETDSRQGAAAFDPGRDACLVSQVRLFACDRQDELARPQDHSAVGLTRLVDEICRRRLGELLLRQVELDARNSSPRNRSTAEVVY